MTCERATAWMPRFLDDELPLVQRWLLHRHLADCGVCGAELKEQRAVQSALRDAITYHRAPLALTARIVASLPREAPPPSSRTWFRLPAVSMTGVGMAGVLAGGALMLLVQRGGPNRADLTNAVIDSHIASLMADHLTDVQTSNQHTVKPWLSAHVDVSPPVRDLTAEGFPLIGGRLDYIDGHSAASVVYRRDRHVINLFAWASPGEANVPPHKETRQGFNVVSWREAGIAYFAVSDVEADQLARFAQLIRGGTT